MRESGRKSVFSFGGPLYRFVRRIIFKLFPKVFQILYGYRVCGEIPEEAVREGCVSICNHVHTLDCIMMAAAFRQHEMQFLTLPSNLRIPVAGLLVRLLGGIPLPEDIKGWRTVYRRVEEAFADGQVLQVYPEGELVSGCRSLREFKTGAFSMAVKYRKPVVPCVIRFYPRYYRNGAVRKDGLELVILPPVFPDDSLKGKAAALRLERLSAERMREALSCRDKAETAVTAGMKVHQEA